jgi:threonine dehydrogenase-like Zn-dependent dehydrogenase
MPRPADLPETMRALQIIEPGAASVIEVPVPQPAHDEVLVRIEAVATCPHWDIHVFSGEPMFVDRPLQYPYVVGEPGHEAVGDVVAIGSNVTTLRVGDRVAAWRDPGGRSQGCYAQFVCLAADDVLAVPVDLRAESLASLELAMCVQVSVDQLVEIDAVRGQRVVVGGLGPAGLVAVQLLRFAGAAEVMAIEPDSARSSLALELGAHEVLAPGDLPPANRFAPTAWHAALDTTGLKVSIEALSARTKRAVAIFGVLREAVYFGPEHWWGGFSLMGYGEHNRASARRALDAIRTANLDLAPLNSRRFPLDRYVDAVGLLRTREALKVLFDPWA